MNKFTRILLLLIIEIIIVILAIGISDVSALAVVIFFPPIFAVTVYFLVVTSVNLRKRHLHSINFILALLFASIALFSTSVGFHYASDDIDNLFLSIKDQLPEPQSLPEDIQQQINILTDRLYFLDELFSHWIWISAILGIGLSIILWWYFITHRQQKEITEINEPLNKTSLMSTFLPTFFGSILGTLLALFSIEGNVIGYGMLFVSLITPILIIKLRKYLVGYEGKQRRSYC